MVRGLVLQRKDVLSVHGDGAEVGRSSPPSMWSRVDLPEPEVPTMATNSPLPDAEDPRRPEPLPGVPGAVVFFQIPGFKNSHGALLSK